MYILQGNIFYKIIFTCIMGIIFTRRSYTSADELKIADVTRDPKVILTYVICTLQTNLFTGWVDKNTVMRQILYDLIYNIMRKWPYLQDSLLKRFYFPKITKWLLLVPILERSILERPFLTRPCLECRPFPEQTILRSYFLRNEEMSYW